jgi:hypothetical protein
MPSCCLIRNPLRSCLVLAVLATAAAAHAQTVVPGTGEHLSQVGDDFEASNWGYTFKNPKNSSELDGESRLPNGFSTNGRWFEGPLRGHPDVIQRVATPADGLPGSTASLLLRSLYTGTPGQPSGKNQQDDLIVNVQQRLRGTIRVSQSPNFVVRVYLPPFEEWEQRSGTSFAVRAGVWGAPSGNRPASAKSRGGLEEYWPGMLIYYQRPDRRRPEPSATILLRAATNGRDVPGLSIDQTGWWTFGMSFTPQGAIEYYASPGVDDLTADDYLDSQYSYGHRCREFETFFFDVMSRDDGRTWSTTWIIDDPALYVHRR